MSPFAQAVLAVLLSRPVYREDVELPDEKRAQLELVAPAIAEASRGDKFVAALLIAIGDAETHWSLRVWRGNCFRYECDAGRARGLWQTHQNAHVTPAQWETLDDPTPEGTLAGARAARSILLYGVHVCGRDPACVLRVFAGKGALSNWSGLGPRLQTFEAARRRL
jgi:hypothetical protein